jgi:hypothetical protein
LLVQPVLLFPLFTALPPPDPPLLLARRPLLLPSLRHARARSGLGRGRVGVSESHRRVRRNKGKGSLLTAGASGSITNDQRSSLPCLTALKLMARLALVAVYSGGMVAQQLRTRQRHRVGRLAHLIDAELPLHEGDDPPMKEVREDRSRPQPGVCYVLQCKQNPADPGAKTGTGRDARSRPSPSAPCRCRGEAGPIVAEVEPLPLPLCVVGGHRAGDVELPARVTQRD